MRNFQLPPNSAMRSESRSPKVSFRSNCLLDVAGKNLVLLQALDDFLVERGKFADLVLQDFFYVILAEFAQIVEADERLCCPSRVLRFLMNSSSDGRISSAIIPLLGDFGFLQIWQICSVVAAWLIGISLLN